MRTHGGYAFFLSGIKQKATQQGQAWDERFSLAFFQISFKDNYIFWILAHLKNHLHPHHPTWCLLVIRLHIACHR